MLGMSSLPDPATGLVLGEDGLARPVWAATDPLLREYYDTEWGVPVRDERGLYERICLEGFQSGLSWATILRKRPAFRSAFADFDPDTVDMRCLVLIGSTQTRVTPSGQVFTSRRYPGC